MSLYRTNGIEQRFYARLGNGETGNLSDYEVRELLKALDQFRRMSCWFGDILAASAEHLLALKSTPKSERTRQLSILASVRECLENEVDPNWRRHDGRDWVVERCTRNIREASQTVERSVVRDAK